MFGQSVRSLSIRLSAPILAAAGLVALPAVLGSATAAAATTPPSVFFGCSGGSETLYTVPTGVDRLFVSAGGGLGAPESLGQKYGGSGARVEAVVPVSAGQQYAVKVGCAAVGRTGGAGWSRGGTGGDSVAFGQGGGGGGSTGVSLVTGATRTPRLVVSGGGGAGGATTFESGQTGVAGNDVPYTGTGGGDGYNGANGWGSTGGGGGGAGGGGWKGGNGGRGGSFFNDEGGKGWGGSSYAATTVQSPRFTVGGSPRSDGYAQFIPLLPSRPVPSVSVFGCNAGKTATYTVPAGTFGVSATVVGGGGAQFAGIGAGGRGASVQGSLSVTPGQTLGVVVGCAGGGAGSDHDKSDPGVGYGNGARGGYNTNSERGGNNGGGGGGASALLSGTTPLIVAGAGGGGGGKGSITNPAGGKGGDGSDTGVRGDPGSGSGAGAGGPAGSDYNNGRTGGRGSDTSCAGAGGGGGGGWLGGGGGNAGSCSRAGGGGGGGPSYTAGSVLNGSITAGVALRSGMVIIAAPRAGLPAAPTAASATAGDASATVAFTPDDDGGAAVTRYTVTSSPSGPAATGATSPITVTGLSNGISYTFTVTATNVIGTSAASAPSNAVTPRTVPGAPTGVSATPGDQQATVSFTPPASNGGAAVTAYTVTSTPGGLTASGSGSPITVAGLTNGTSYTFTVAAVNAAGTGAVSAPSAAVVPATVPSPPLLVAAEPRDGKALVSFHAPLSDGGAPVTFYTVTSSPGGISATGGGSPITVNGLTNGTTYTFTVTAHNGIGASQPSTASNSVTPSAATTLGPPNDDFADAQVITGTSGTVTGSNVGATVETGEPQADLYRSGGATVWYRWDVPVGGGAVQFDLCGTGFDGTLGVFQGSSVSELSNIYPGRPRVNCLDGTTAPAAVFDLNINGGTYYIAVGGADDTGAPATGNITLRWAPSTGGGGG